MGLGIFGSRGLGSRGVLFGGSRDCRARRAQGNLVAPDHVPNMSGVIDLGGCLRQSSTHFNLTRSQLCLSDRGSGCERECKSEAKDGRLHNLKSVG